MLDTRFIWINCFHPVERLDDFAHLVLTNIGRFDLLAIQIDNKEHNSAEAGPKIELRIVMTLREFDILLELLLINLGILIRLEPNHCVGDPLHVYLLQPLLPGHLLAIPLVTVIVIQLLINLLTILLVLLVVVVQDLHALVLEWMQLDLLGILLHQEDAGVDLRIQRLVALTLAVKRLYRVLVRRQVVEPLVGQHIVIADVLPQVPKFAGRTLDIVKVRVGVDLERLDEARLVDELVVPLMLLFVVKVLLAFTVRC